MPTAADIERSYVKMSKAEKEALAEEVRRRRAELTERMERVYGKLDDVNKALRNR